MAPTNTAAWLTAEKVHPLELKSAPLETPAANQVLVKNHAVAINPIDGKLQALAIYPLQYPTILGQDVSGEVVSVGPNVTRFRPGDRVIGNTAGFATKQNTEKAFQVYTILETRMTSKIPNSISFSTAVVLPLSVSTASSGLFHPDFLNMQNPTEPAQKPTGETLLVWGGASSVGSSVIQLAVAAGCEVFTTASPKNFQYVKKLGASQVFDYNSPTVVSELVELFKGKKLIGAFDAVGGLGAWVSTAEVIHKTEGAKKFVATVTPRFPEPPEGVTMKQVSSLSIRENHVAKAVWEDFLPTALGAGTFVPAPEPLVAGHGLESIQGAIDRQRKGTSAQKVVVTL